MDFYQMVGRAVGIGPDPPIRVDTGRELGDPAGNHGPLNCEADGDGTPQFGGRQLLVA
jgi:hypothetical protein